MPHTPEQVLQLRMAARAKLAGLPPRFLFCSPKQGPDGKWYNPEPNVASCGEERIYRREGESVEEFQHRAISEFFPANGVSWPFVSLDCEILETSTSHNANAGQRANDSVHG